MPPRQWDLRVVDMLRACDAILEFTRGMTVEQFRMDRRTFDAVVRNIQVVGEAARHVPDGARARFPEVPWQDVADVRNVVIHQYFGVDIEIVWRTVTTDVPLLRDQLRKVLEALVGESYPHGAMATSLLAEFLRDEATPHVRRMVEVAVETAASTVRQRELLKFNRFSLTIDYAQGTALLEDDLAPNCTQVVSLEAFLEVLHSTPPSFEP